MTEQDTKVSMTTAATWTKAWRKKMTDGNWLQSNMKKGFLIPMVNFEKLKAQGATNIRAYMALDESETDQSKALKLVLVGVDANGNDMINEDQGDFAYDFTVPCPPICPPDNPINSDE